MGIVNAETGSSPALIGAQMGISVVGMDSTEYAAHVADKTRRALEAAGETVSSASRKSGIPHSTLDRKFNSGRGTNPLTVRELYELAAVSGVAASELAKTYQVADESGLAA